MKLKRKKPMRKEIKIGKVSKRYAAYFKKHVEKEHPNTRGKIRIVKA